MAGSDSNHSLPRESRRCAKTKEYENVLKNFPPRQDSGLEIKKINVNWSKANSDYLREKLMCDICFQYEIFVVF